MSNTSVCECWTNVDSAEEFKHLLLWRNLLALQSRAVGFISPAPLSLLARSVSAFFGGTNLSMCVTLNPVPRINDLVNLRPATTQNTAPQPVQTLLVESACGDLSSKSCGNVKILQKVSQSARVCLVCVITSLGFLLVKSASISLWPPCFDHLALKRLKSKQQASERGKQCFRVWPPGRSCKTERDWNLLNARRKESEKVAYWISNWVLQQSIVCRYSTTAYIFL